MRNWDDLRHVLAVVREGGLAPAALRLGVSHTTISRRILACEEALGVRLFDRLPEGYRPTEAGARAAEAAERMEEEADAFARVVSGRDTALAGPIRVTAPLAIVQGPFTEMLAAFRAQHPEIEVSLLVSNDLADLHRRAADIAVRSTDTPDENLIGVRVGEQRGGAFAARSALAAGGRIGWIAGAADGVPDWVTAAYPEAHVVARTTELLGRAAMARAGLGATFLPCVMGDRDPDLVRVPSLALQRLPDKWILIHPDLKRVARIMAFVRFTARQGRAMRALFMGETVRDEAAA